MRNRIALAMTETRLAALRERGIAALSAYDREVPEGDDAERALLVATRLVQNQRAHFARGRPLRRAGAADERL